MPKTGPQSHISDFMVEAGERKLAWMLRLPAPARASWFEEASLGRGVEMDGAILNKQKNRYLLQ